MKNIVNVVTSKMKLFFAGAIGALYGFSTPAIAGIGDLDDVAPEDIDVSTPAKMGEGLFTFGVTLVAGIIAAVVVAGTAWHIYQAFAEYTTSPKPSLTKLGLTTVIGTVIIIATVGLVLFAIMIATPD